MISHLRNMVFFLILALLSMAVSPGLMGQGMNQDFERVKVGDKYKHIFVGLEISPDGKNMAISGVQSFPFYIYDWKEKKILKEFDVGEWYAGSTVKYSTTGKYLLLNQLFYIDMNVNKDREVKFEVIDAETGKRILKFDEYHAVTFSPDEQSAAALSGNTISFWNIETGKKEKSFRVHEASNGIAISPDGNTIAVSHRVSDEELAALPRYKKDKKARKFISKYKQQITLYDLRTFTKIKTVNEFYDIVYRLEYSKDGKQLFCLNIPHLKAQTGIGQRQTYVNIIDGETGEPQRRGYNSQSFYEPDFKLSPDGKLFGLVSHQSRFLELHVFDAETKKMLYRFTQSFRLFEKSEGEFTMSDSRMSFVFLPDGETIVMTMGNRLVYWKYKPENN
ncbi:MAG: WD40 repeat domain-containing protein [Chlorobi bacterium]|nr:WD40 repeat domain-containing protein [Chlorobiota bacterium]